MNDIQEFAHQKILMGTYDNESDKRHLILNIALWKFEVWISSKNDKCHILYSVNEKYDDALFDADEWHF